MNKRVKKKPVGRPRSNKEVREVCSFRLENSIKILIITRFGSVQKWIDKVLYEIKKSKEREE